MIDADVKHNVFCIAHAKSNGVKLTSPSAIGYYLTFSMLGLDEGQAFALFLDRNKKLIRTLRLKRHGKMISSTVIDAISSTVRELRSAKYFLLVHNHKNKPLTPSPEDIITTDVVSEHFRDSGISFIGHYITSGVDYVLLTDKGIERRSYINQPESTEIPNDK